MGHPGAPAQTGREHIVLYRVCFRFCLNVQQLPELNMHFNGLSPLSTPRKKKQNITITHMTKPASRLVHKTSGPRNHDLRYYAWWNYAMRHTAGLNGLEALQAGPLQPAN